MSGPTVPTPQTYNYQQPGFADLSALAGVQQMGANNVAQQQQPDFQAMTNSFFGGAGGPGGWMGNFNRNVQQTKGQVDQAVGQAGQISNSLMDPNNAANRNITGASNMDFGAALADMNTANQVGGTASGLWAHAPALYRQGDQAGAYAGQALQAGFDPQNAYYNQQRQLNTDQTRATLAAQGLSTSVYGSQVEGDSNRRFNIAQGHDQLARQQQGAQTAGMLDSTMANMYGAGAGQIGAGNQAMTSAAGMRGMGGQLNQQGTALAQSIPAQQMAALQAYLGAQQQGQQIRQAPYKFGQALLGGQAQNAQMANATTQQQVDDFLRYLGGNTSALSQTNQSQLAATSQQNLQDQQFLQTLTSGIGGAAKLGTSWLGY